MGHCEGFIRERFLIYEHMFSVEGVEAAIKKLDMARGHENPLDSVYKLAQIRKGTKDRPQPTQLVAWVTNAMVDNILMGVEAVQSISVNDLMARRNK